MIFWFLSIPRLRLNFSVVKSSIMFCNEVISSCSSLDIPLPVLIPPNGVSVEPLPSISEIEDSPPICSFLRLDSKIPLSKLESRCSSFLFFSLSKNLEKEYGTSSALSYPSFFFVGRKIASNSSIGTSIVAFFCFVGGAIFFSGVTNRFTYSSGSKLSSNDDIFFLSMSASSCSSKLRIFIFTGGVASSSIILPPATL